MIAWHGAQRLLEVAKCLQRHQILLLPYQEYHSVVPLQYDLVEPYLVQVICRGQFSLLELTSKEVIQQHTLVVVE